MKRLLILRHAKAEPGMGVDDFDRALTAGGREDARVLGAWLLARGWTPQATLHSSARRTAETAQIVAAEWPATIEVRGEVGLYNATAAMLIALARRTPGDVDLLLIVGHNPGMSDMAHQLAGSGDETDRLRLAGKFPTCGLAALDFAVDDWADIGPRRGRLAAFVTPADLGLRG